MKNPYNPRLLLIAAFALAVTQVQASTTYYAIDPGARNALNQMQAAYTAMNSLSEEVVSAESSDVPNHLTTHTTIKLLRPGFVSINSDSTSSRTGDTCVLTDGSYCFVTAPQYPTRYLKFPVTADASALTAASAQDILASLTLALFTDPAAIGTFFPDSHLATLQRAHETIIEGDKVNVVVISDRSGVTITLFIGQKDHLLKRITALSPDKPGVFTETYSSVVPNAPLTQSAFVFSPPPHMDAYNATNFNQDPNTLAGQQQ
jgi:outer membrane lipoprotein-sorting protein